MMKVKSFWNILVPFVLAVGILSIVFLSDTSNSGSQHVYSQQNKTSRVPTTPVAQSWSNNTNNTFISVPATAVAIIKPDRVSLTLGVETANKTANEALSRNSDSMTKILSGLFSNGVKQNETSTSAFSISPNYNYSQGRNMITGFTATNSILIMSPNINDTGKWIDNAISSGATSVQSVVFELSEKKLSEIKNELINQAINNAKSSAYTAAASLGMKVVGMKSLFINDFENPVNNPQPFFKNSLAEPAGANTTPIISGEQRVSLSITTNWLMK
jgi:uncharacterized protein YggE